MSEQIIRVDGRKATDVITKSGDYIRFSAESWWQFIGESLECVQFPQDLEQAYQAFPSLPATDHITLLRELKRTVDLAVSSVDIETLVSMTDEEAEAYKAQFGDYDLIVCHLGIKDLISIREI